MRLIILILFTFISVACSSQNFKPCKECDDKMALCNVHIGKVGALGNGYGVTITGSPITTAEWKGNIGYGRGYQTLEITGSCCTKIGYNYPAFKEEKCIVIYLDGLEVKADSATKFYKADTSMYVLPRYDQSITDWGGSTMTTELRMPTVEPNWYIQKVIRRNKKEIPLQSIIQYK